MNITFYNRNRDRHLPHEGSAVLFKNFAVCLFVSQFNRGHRPAQKELTARCRDACLPVSSFLGGFLRIHEGDRQNEYRNQASPSETRSRDQRRAYDDGSPVADLWLTLLEARTRDGVGQVRRNRAGLSAARASRLVGNRVYRVGNQTHRAGWQQHDIKQSNDIGERDFAIQYVVNTTKRHKTGAQKPAVKKQQAFWAFFVGNDARKGAL